MNIRSGVAIVAVALVVSGCSGGDDASSTASTTGGAASATTQVPTTADVTATAGIDATTTTVAPASTTMAVAETTTSTRTPSDQVGSRRELRKLIRDLAEALEFEAEAVVTADVPLDPPIPDLTNPDPRVALEEAFGFSVWAVGTLPVAEWLDVITVPDSQARILYEGDYDRLYFDGRTLVFAEPGVTFSSIEEVAPEDSDAPVEVLDALPAGTVMLEYTYSVGARSFVDSLTGEAESADPGWTDFTAYAALTPTDTGWKLFYDTPEVPI